MAVPTSPTPILNPVLTLKKTPASKRPRGGGKKLTPELEARAQFNQSILASQIDTLLGSSSPLIDFDGLVHIHVKMGEKFFAPSHLPNDILNSDIEADFVLATTKGFLIELPKSQLAQLKSRILNPTNRKVVVDIARIEEISSYNVEDVLNGKSLSDYWDIASDLERSEKMFILWLTPFKDTVARSKLVEVLESKLQETHSSTIYPLLALDDSGSSPDTLVSVKATSQSSLARAARSYREYGKAALTVTIPNKKSLFDLVSSGTVYRIEPVTRLCLAPAAENVPDPDFDASKVQNAPIVGLIDGGMSANSYKPCVGWIAPPLIPDQSADLKHGNQVCSVLVNGHEWNPDLLLPDLYCRVGVVQAVPKRGAAGASFEELINYLRLIISRNPETRVWNFSANVEEEVDGAYVSYLGAELAKISREFSVLFVISAGNKSDGINKICPPADCEAALVVGGRKANVIGHPGAACDGSCFGPGPAGMLKPETSWFSNVRVLGGVQVAGTSFSAPLISRIAAHTFTNLKNPSPDLVKGLIIDSCEQKSFSPNLGWGTPYGENVVPWICRPGTVTLSWQAELSGGYLYYWNDIPIPPQMVKNGKLIGVASLVAILEPITSGSPTPNYFQTRLETALQRPTGPKKWGNMLGTMREGKDAEQSARKNLAKWSPTRFHRKDFKKRPLSFSGTHFRLYARVFARDGFDYNVLSNQDLPLQKVTFILSLSDGTQTSDLYNFVKTSFRMFVESAVVNQEIEVETRS